MRLLRILPLFVDAARLEELLKSIDSVNLRCRVEIVQKSVFSSFVEFESCIERHIFDGVTYVIIDTKSLNTNNDEAEKEAKKESGKFIRHIIQAYPEVTVLFYDTNEINFKNLIFLEDAPDFQEKEVFDFKYHLIDQNNLAAFKECRDNIFDASRLRQAVRLYEESYKMVPFNFPNILYSRISNIALCVEEEYAQNLLHGFLLFRNGYSVYPIINALALEKFNESYRDIANRACNACDLAKDRLSSSVNYDLNFIIIRDYDLQFEDIGKKPVTFIEYDSLSQVLKDEGNKEIDSRGTISLYSRTMSTKCVSSTVCGELNPQMGHDYNDLPNKLKKTVIESPEDASRDTRVEIRNIPGYKYLTITDEQAKQISKLTKKYLAIDLIRGVTKEFGDIRMNSPYWGYMSTMHNTYFISSTSKFKLMPSNDIEGDRLPGLKKPVVGIYKNLQAIENVKQTYNRSIDAEKIRHERTNREEGHSHALDVYNDAYNLIRRARKYISFGDYIRAAVLASEAIEILNGYHLSTTIEAYHYKSIAENAIAMNILGGDEKSLADDTAFRVDLIKKDVMRFFDNDEKLAKNVLNQIFSDCRQYCHEKEHFEAEDVFIDAMAKLNEGLDVIEQVKSSANQAWCFVSDTFNHVGRFINNTIKQGRKSHHKSNGKD